MSAASVTAYLSPTMPRKRAISSGGSGDAAASTIFIVCILLFCFCGYSVPPHRGTAQPVIDRLAEPVMRHRHHGDGARTFAVEGTKVAEKISRGLIEIAARGQIHYRTRRIDICHGAWPEGQQRLAGLHPLGIEPHRRARRIMRCQH